jgi:RND superfamily putative drug exporter
VATYLYRIGKLAYRRKGIVLATWLTILVLAGVGAATLSGPTANSFSIPGTPAQAALDLQSERFGSAEDPLNAVSAQYVFAAPEGESLDTPAYTAAIDATIAEIDKIDEVNPSVKPGGEKPLANPVAGNESIVEQYNERRQRPAPPPTSQLPTLRLSRRSPRTATSASSTFRSAATSPTSPTNCAPSSTTPPRPPAMQD